MPEITYRVVDWENQGWHLAGGKDGATLYAADYGFMRGLEDRSLAELEATRGPIRPVENITDHDAGALRGLFGMAGRKTVATLAAALETTFHEIRESRGGRDGPGSYEYARRTMMAGREGSWESGFLIEIVLWGNELNLAKETRALRGVDARRAGGPSKRVDAGVRDVLAGMFLRWVSDPERFTEVAETLAFAVSCYCDDTAGTGGWRAVADQWLQPGGLAQETSSMCYRLFYSLSEHFDTGLI